MSPAFTEADLATERWKVVPGFDGYEASTLGRIRSYLRRGRGSDRRKEPRVMVLGKGPGGYPKIHLQRDGKTYTRIAHSVILETFVGPCPPGMETRHFPDRTRTNIRLSNLSFCTPKQNGEDRVLHGTSGRLEISDDVVAAVWGSDRPAKVEAANHGLTVDNVHRIRRGELSNGRGRSPIKPRYKQRTGLRTGEKAGNARLTEDKVRYAFFSHLPAPAIASELGVSPSCIRRIRRGVDWSHLNLRHEAEAAQ